jgi:hypothetical protein
MLPAHADYVTHHYRFEDGPECPSWHKDWSKTPLRLRVTEVVVTYYPGDDTVQAEVRGRVLKADGSYDGRYTTSERADNATDRAYAIAWAKQQQDARA